MQGIRILKKALHGFAWLTCLTWLSSSLPVAAAPTQIEIWHGLQGIPAATLGRLIERFHDEQAAVRVTLVDKGDDDAVVATALKAARERKPLPHLLQVADDQAGAVLAVRGFALPLAEALGRGNQTDIRFFGPAVAAFTRDRDGRQFGFPLDVSIPLFFYNKDAYRQAGLDPDAPPRTWRELQGHLIALRSPTTGIACGYTTSSQAWIHVENLGMSHGETVASKNNGSDGPAAALTFNGLLHVRHLALMMSWVRSDLFTLSGFGRQGDARFVAGECATLSSASAVLGELGAAPRFPYGVAPMPYHEEGAAGTMASLAGGSALWATAGKKPAEQAAVARFLTWLASAPIALAWHEQTGTLPWTEAAYRAALADGVYDRVAGLTPIMKTLAEGGGPRAVMAQRGLRLPHHNRVRRVINDQLQAVWSGAKAAKQGLDDAVRQGNAAMRGVAVVAASDIAPVERPTRAAPRL